MNLYVKPARPGEVIKDPRTGRELPAGGGHVPNTTFWQRRRAQGDVLDAEPPPPAPTTSRAAPIVRRESE